jgi:hypothetical protein
MAVRKRPVATGFVVHVPLYEGISVHYAVTARHVLESDRMAPVFLRVNTVGGGSRYIRTESDDWIYHELADVALHPFHRSNDMAIRSIPAESLVTPGPDADYKMILRAAIDDRNYQQDTFIKTGDQIAIIGLFVENYGDSENLPVARFGHIARMPSLVNTPRWRGDAFKSHAFLIECLSWGGMSGSPVVVFRDFRINIPKDDGSVLTNVFGAPCLLGLITGHIDRYRRATTRGDYGTIKTPLNTGIAVVTPAAAIDQLLLREDMMERHAEIVESVCSVKSSVSLDMQAQRNPERSGAADGLAP